MAEQQNWEGLLSFSIVLLFPLMIMPNVMIAAKEGCLKALSQYPISQDNDKSIITEQIMKGKFGAEKQ